MNSIIQISNLNAAYEGKTVLSQVNLTVYERDFLGIIGPNGGGKTTLVKCILGLHKPEQGNIRFFKNGKEVSNINMGYLPQYNSIDRKFPISVYEVILSGLSKQKPLLQRYNKAHHEQVRQIIARMGLEGLEERAIGELSGGQLQRTLLGRALVSNPEVVILDEPNTYIDKRFETKLYSLLEEINRERAIVLVSHDIGTVLKNVKTIACVNETVHYHPHTELPTEWLEEHFGCPIEMLGHGTFPHRVLKCHHEH
ncbi:MAG: ABC transporter ATP-binding protein [Bacteroides sp.]|nr:ABC transporter ATP-binding protein [Bacteroides sp.]